MTHDDNQREMPAPGLIEELHAHYKEQAQAVNRRLERGWQRIERRVEKEQQRRQHTQHPTQLPSLQERLSPMQQPSPLANVSRPWPSRLVTLAAVGLLGVLIGGLIGGLILVRHNGNKTSHHASATATTIPTLAPTPTTPTNSAGLLFDTFQMIDATTGWAVAVPPNTQWGDLALYKVLRTTDGGRHWQSVTPNFNTAQAQVSSAPFRPYSGGSLPVLQLFLSDSVAWMLDLPSTLFGTADGGRTWQKTTAPAQVAQYNFINATDGWMLGTNGGVYQTTDGGQIWTKLQSMSQGQPSSGILPYSATVTGMVFLNMNDGWLTGLTNQTDAVWVYATHDGGKTWIHQALTLPAGTIDPPLLVDPPTFVSDHDGFMWANINIHPVLQERAGIPQSGGGALQLYLTHDAGATWQYMGMFPGIGIGPITFSDGNHGWVAGYSANQSGLWMTSDGAQHWSQLSTSQNFTSITQIDFVSQTTGWALSYPIYNQSPTLLQTQDGGHTWTEINYNIS